MELDDIPLASQTAPQAEKGKSDIDANKARAARRR
jgi:hypothetical protein